jgi:hypothetical protein
MRESERRAWTEYYKQLTAAAKNKAKPRRAESKTNAPVPSCEEGERALDELIKATEESGR